MRIKLAYGETGLEVNLPDEWNVTVVEPRFVPGLSDPHDAIQRIRLRFELALAQQQAHLDRLTAA